MPTKKAIFTINWPDLNAATIRLNFFINWFDFFRFFRNQLGVEYVKIIFFIKANLKDGIMNNDGFIGHIRSLTLASQQIAGAKGLPIEIVQVGKIDERLSAICIDDVRNGVVHRDVLSRIDFNDIVGNLFWERQMGLQYDTAVFTTGNKAFSVLYQSLGRCGKDVALVVDKEQLSASSIFNNTVRKMFFLDDCAMRFADKVTQRRKTILLHGFDSLVTPVRVPLDRSEQIYFKPRE